MTSRNLILDRTVVATLRNHRIADRMSVVRVTNTLVLLGIIFVLRLGIASAIEPQQESTEALPISSSKAAEPWQTDLSELFIHLQDVVRKGNVPTGQYLADGISKGTDSWAMPVLDRYADADNLHFFNGVADRKPGNGTVQWCVNEAFKGKSVDWEFEVAQSRTITVNDETRFLQLVPRYDDGGEKLNPIIPITRPSTIRIPVAKQSKVPALVVGDRVRVEGTIGDYSANRGVELATLVGPIVVYKRSNNDVPLQTTVSFGLQNAKLTTTKRISPLRFRKVVSVPTTNRDDFTNARVAVSIDQNSVISRNYLVTAGGGRDERDRIGAYLWSLDQKNPKRTRLPDSTTFGFVPNSTLAYQVHWGDGVRFWDTRTHEVSGDYLPHELREDTTMGPAVSPSGKVMVTRSQLDHLKFWDIETRKPLTEEIEQRGIVYGMKFSSDGKWFFCSTPKHLTVWDADTGERAAGPYRNDISGFAYSSKNKQLVTFENNDQKEDAWRSKLVIRSDDGFDEVRQVALEGHAREAKWVGDAHLLVVADNRDSGKERTLSYGRKLVYLVSLEARTPNVSTLMRRNWISNVHVAPDGNYFLIRTSLETSCWQVGQSEPIWTKPGKHLVYLGDKDWVLLHSGPAIAHQLDDGKELWRSGSVGMARVIGPNIWICNEREMEVWRAESQ